MQIVLTHPTNIGAMATRLFCKREKLERKYISSSSEIIW